MRWLPRSLKPGAEHSEWGRSLQAEWPTLTLDEMVRLDRLKHVLLESGCSDGRSPDDGTYQRPFDRQTYSRLMYPVVNLDRISGGGYGEIHVEMARRWRTEQKTADQESE